MLRHVCGPGRPLIEEGGYQLRGDLPGGGGPPGGSPGGARCAGGSGRPPEGPGRLLIEEGGYQLRGDLPGGGGPPGGSPGGARCAGGSGRPPEGPGGIFPCRGSPWILGAALVIARPPSWVVRRQSSKRLGFEAARLQGAGQISSCRGRHPVPASCAGARARARLYLGGVFCGLAAWLEREASSSHETKSGRGRTAGGSGYISHLNQ